LSVAPSFLFMANSCFSSLFPLVACLPAGADRN
jgi:hypothetical protein